MAVQHSFEESDSRLDALVQEINQTLETRTLQTALQVGALVVAAIFDGDLSRVTDTSRGSMSYRKLAAHPDLAVSYSKLWQMVQVTAQHGDLPDEARGLSYTHQRALLHAPAETVRNELAVQAATERWPSRKLEQRLREVRVKRSKGGRPPTATFMRALDQLEGIRRGLEGDARHEVLFRGLNGGETVDAVQRFESALQALGTVQREIRRRALARCGR